MRKVNEIWGKIKKIMKIRKNGSEPAFGDKYLRTKIKLSQIFIVKLPIKNPVFKSGKTYYPKTLLKECKYKIKEKEIQSFIEDDLKGFSNDDSEEEKKTE